MTVRSNHLGYPAHMDKKMGEWVYDDTGEVVDGSNRPCRHCGRPTTEKGHDACIVDLPGVKNACCGHGYKVDPTSASPRPYVQFHDGACLYGEEAAVWIKQVQERSAGI